MTWHETWRRGVSASRTGLGGLHLGVAIVSFLRPNLALIVPSYAGFHAIMPTIFWGVTALTIALGLLLIPRGKPLLILWQFASAVFFILFSILVTQGPYGLTWGSVVYGGLGLWSCVLAYYTADDWFWHNRWPQRFRVWLTKCWGHRGRS
ncbi:hypothetical protein [Deinococcus apachensis]|uniref:hypothetical protein n=1 Tax=Deinococcus apachensis TaxID=309886 RepID=UPI00036298EA|nr:hypothetical protein [Deinococcus apachensis]